MAAGIVGLGDQGHAQPRPDRSLHEGGDPKRAFSVWDVLDLTFGTELVVGELGMERIK